MPSGLRITGGQCLPSPYAFSNPRALRAGYLGARRQPLPRNSTAVCHRGPTVGEAKNHYRTEEQEIRRQHRTSARDPCSHHHCMCAKADWTSRIRKIATITAPTLNIAAERPCSAKASYQPQAVCYGHDYRRLGCSRLAPAERCRFFTPTDAEQSRSTCAHRKVTLRRNCAYCAVMNCRHSHVFVSRVRLSIILMTPRR